MYDTCHFFLIIKSIPTLFHTSTEFTAVCSVELNSAAKFSHSFFMLFYVWPYLVAVLEYCSPIWHHGLTKAQAESLKAIQCQALRIINSSTVGMPYEVALSLTQFATLHDRREHLNKIFFTSITIPSSCISRLLPPLRDSSITS